MNRDAAAFLVRLAELLREAGWAEKGGYVVRDPHTDAVVDRTVWVPRCEWWRDKPEDLTEKRAHEVLFAALRGRKLGARQRRHLAYLIDVAQRPDEREGWEGDGDGERR
jgi:hypothetical protein